jgi:hypothetical protein
MNKRLLLLLLCIPILSWGEKPQYWQTILQPIGKIKDTRFLFRQHYRFDLEQFKLVDGRFSLDTITKLNKTWNFGLNFTYVNNRRPDVNPFTQHFRWEIELNPHFQLTKNTALRFRNRYEFIKNEFVPQWEQVFRQRQQINMAVNYRSLKSISFHNEVFYNVTLEKWSQIRLVPLELNFEVGQEHTYSVFAMIRWLRPGQTWDPQLVLGTTLDW